VPQTSEPIISWRSTLSAAALSMLHVKLPFAWLISIRLTSTLLPAYRRCTRGRQITALLHVMQASALSGYDSITGSVSGGNERAPPPKRTQNTTRRSRRHAARGMTTEISRTNIAAPEWRAGKRRALRSPPESH
jgi:hypothetical protein